MINEESVHEDHTLIAWNRKGAVMMSALPRVRVQVPVSRHNSRVT